MITSYLTLYLLFIILASLVISLLVLRLGLPSPQLIIILVLLFIVSPLAIGYFYFSYFDSLPEIAVPDVRGMDFESARSKLEESDLNARLAGSIYQTKYREGIIASQRPEAGRRVKVGRMVNLMISSGKRKVPAPNLLGRPVSQAEAVLSAAQLMVGEVKRERNLDAPDGTVLAQEPLPGEEAEVGGTVDLLVSTTGEVRSEDDSSGTPEGSTNQ